jgi:hypothetical protein
VIAMVISVLPFQSMNVVAAKDNPPRDRMGTGGIAWLSTSQIPRSRNRY